jgi:hypothetical protein
MVVSGQNHAAQQLVYLMMASYAETGSDFQ